MKLEHLPIWPRILAAKPHGCRATRPINILRAVLRAGGLQQAGPLCKTANRRDFHNSLHLVELYSSGQAGLPPRAVSRAGYTPRSRRFPDRDARRERNDPKFRRAQMRARAKAQRLRDVVTHIADRAALAAGVRGELNWGGAVRFSFTGNYKNGSYRPTHAQPGVRLCDGSIILERTGNARPIIVGPVPGRSLIKHAALNEPHPVGLLAVPLKNQPGVFACMDVRDGKWCIIGFSVSGHLVPECVARGTITLADIQTETNDETQRIMIERFGIDRYVRESGMAPIQSDDWGTLYDLGTHKVVRLLNSTPNPDGSVNEYFRRVPASCRTAHEAVAWTFGLTAEEYQPAVQS
jgi:hypothetical protein